MDDFKPVDTTFTPKYWNGASNIFVRYWVYLSMGLDFINQGKYLIVGILGLYAVLKLSDIRLMVLMFLVSIPILTVMGRWKLYKVSQTQEFITTTRGSVLGYRNYNIAVKQIELLEEIKDLLRTANRA